MSKRRELRPGTLAHYRKAIKGMTQEELRIAAGVTRKTISVAEMGRGTKSTTIEAIAMGLGVTMDYAMHLWRGSAEYAATTTPHSKEKEVGI